MNGLCDGSSRSLVCLKVVISIQANGNEAKAVNAAITPKLTTPPATFLGSAITPPRTAGRAGGAAPRTPRGRAAGTAPRQRLRKGPLLSLIHISEPTRLLSIS